MTKRHVILAAVDGGSRVDDIVRATLAAVRGQDTSELHFVFVAEPPIDDALQMIRVTDLLEEGRALLERVAATVKERFPGRIEGHLVVDVAAAGILQVAADLEADLIIVGSHGKRGFKRLVLGSVARTVVDRAHCAVLVARPASYAPSGVPEIEPPCPRCRETQTRTAGAELWCAEHSHRRVTPHLHYRAAEPYAVGSSLLRPEGSAF